MKTGVSDHHALIVLFLKTTFTKMPPNKLKHINYKLLEQIHSWKTLKTYQQITPLKKKSEMVE